MSVLRFIGGVAALAAVGGGGWLGREVPVAEQWPMFEALRTTAAIIFAVIGAWMAIIYPERLRLSFRREVPSTPNSNGTGWGQLFAPVVHSTGILAVILVLGVLLPLLKAHPPALPLPVLRGSMYGLLVALTLWQLWTVLLTLVPADTVKSFLDQEDDRKRAIDGFTVGTGRRRNGAQE